MITGCGIGDVATLRRIWLYSRITKKRCRLPVGMKEDSTTLVGLYVKEKDTTKETLQNHLEQEGEGTGNRRIAEVMKSGEIESH